MAKCKRSICPVSSMLDILGDKWTLLVIRDLMLGKQTFKELQQSAEKIPSNILSERLKRLEREQLVERQKYQDRPVRYKYILKQKGLDLAPVMMSMVEWANKYLEDTMSMEEVVALLDASAEKE